MRDLGYVCLRCRVGQLIACDARRIRRPGRAASFSTGTGTSTAISTSTNDPIQHERRQGQPAAGQPVAKFRRRPQTGPGGTHSRSQHQPSDRSDSLITLFHSVVNNRPEQANPSTPRSLEASGESPGIMELWQAVHRMQSLLDKGSSAETTWGFFEETLYPRIVNIGGGEAVPRIILRRLYGSFFVQIAEGKAKDFTRPGLPSLELITHRMAELGALWAWTPMMLQLVDSIRKINPSLDAYPSLEDHEAAMARRATLVRDLQLAWRAFTVQGAFTGPPPLKSPDNSQKAFANAFAALFPGYDKGLMYRPMWVALASYGVLTDPKLEFGVQESAFVAMMRPLVERNALPFAEDHQTFAQLCPTDLYAYVLVRLWVGMKSEASRRGSRTRQKSELRSTALTEGAISVATKLSPQNQPGQTAWISKESYGARLSHLARSSQSEWARLEKATGAAQPRQTTQRIQYTYRTLDLRREPVQASQPDVEATPPKGDHAHQPSPAGSFVEADEPVQIPQEDETQPSQRVASQPPQISQAVPETEPEVAMTEELEVPMTEDLEVPVTEELEVAVAEETTPTGQQNDDQTSQPSQEVQTSQAAQDEDSKLSEKQPAQPTLTKSQTDPEIQAPKTDENNQPNLIAVAESSQSVQEAQGNQEVQLLPESDPSPSVVANPSVVTSQPAQVAAPEIKVVQPSQAPKPTPTHQANQLDKIAPAKRSMQPERRQTIRRLDTSESAFEHFSTRMHKKIGQAIKQRSTMLLDRTWDEFWGEEAEPSAAQLKRLNDMVDLFDYFIIAYNDLRKPSRAIFVWNAMLQIGLKPTIKTWTAMIQGCTKAGNPEGIKLIWSRLVASGIKLDTPIWTARISGLIISGDLASGVDALNEMADIWKNRDAPENAAIAVKPSIEPVNAALAWLLRLDRTSTAETLLQWAARQDIQPDIFTFNTLLRPLVREGNTTEMNRIFDSMKEVGVHADIVTYTILLDGALANVAAMTPDEQTAAVTRVMAQMEKAGVEANMMAYAKILYNLLQDNNQNAAAAVRAVLAHIWDRGLELTSHIYTMLAEHYFSRDPPDAEAVTHLISSRRLAFNPNIDRVFWERVIKGYCQAGEVQRAVNIFRHVSSMGSTMTFSTLFEFLNSLATSNMMDEARQLVQMARKMNEAEESDGGVKPTRFWKHRFWHLADAYGLLEAGLLEEYLAGRRPVAGRGGRRGGQAGM